MGALLARNPALRGLGPWLLAMLVTGQVIAGVYAYVVRDGGEVTLLPLLIGGWMLVAEYLAWSHARHRCTRFDLSLPLPGPTLWTASLIGAILAGAILLATILGTTGAVLWLVATFSSLPTPPVGDVLGAAAVLAASLIAGTAWLHARHVDLAGAPGGLRASLTNHAVYLAWLGPLVLLRDRPWLLVALGLAVAAALIVATRRRVGEGLVLLPREPADRERAAAPAADGPGVARPARGPRAVWLHYQMLVRTAPKGPALLVVLTPFMLLFGALLSGLLQHLAPDADLRFAWLPMTAYMCVTFAAPLLANLRAVDALPLGRRYLLLLASAPALLVFSVGYLGGLMWMAQAEPVLPEVVFSDTDEGYGVRVPPYMWRVSWSGEAPPATSPSGETHPVMTIPLVKGATPVVYKPYTTPVGSSREFVAWQIRRAAAAMHGTDLTAEEIADRFLWTDEDGRVRLRTERLDLRSGVWGIAARSPGPFFPVALALVGGLMYLGLAVYARAVRAGISRARRNARLWIVLGALLLVHLAPHALTLAGLSRPWVLERAGVDLMMTFARSVPGGYTGLWIAALLIVAAAFEGAHHAFRRAESPVEPESCMWTMLSKGD